MASKVQSTSARQAIVPRQRILLCYDGSAEARRALERVGEIASVVPSRKMESASDRFTKLAGSQVTKWRWAIGLQGLASVVFGVLILAWPEISVYALTIVFGVYTLATGITACAAAFSSHTKDERASLVLPGLLGIVVGIVVLAWPGISALALLYVICAYAVLLGTVAIIASLRLPLDGRDTALMILNGLASIVFGIVTRPRPARDTSVELAISSPPRRVPSRR